MLIAVISIIPLLFLGVVVPYFIILCVRKVFHIW
jgi:hypothetical protein